MGKGKKIYWAESEESRRRRTEQRERERENRRKNVVIKGVDWNEGSNEGTVKEFIREKKKVKAKIERTQMIRVGNKNTIIMAMMNSMEEKIRVMKEKRKLEKGIYIDDDLTRKEREVQQQIRRITKAKREKGEYVRIGYKKLKIENR